MQKSSECHVHATASRCAPHRRRPPFKTARGAVPGAAPALCVVHRLCNKGQVGRSREKRKKWPMTRGWPQWQVSPRRSALRRCAAAHRIKRNAGGKGNRSAAHERLQRVQQQQGETREKQRNDYETRQAPRLSSTVRRAASQRAPRQPRKRHGRWGSAAAGAQGSAARARSRRKSKGSARARGAPRRPTCATRASERGREKRAPTPGGAQRRRYPQRRGRGGGGRRGDRGLTMVAVGLGCKSGCRTERGRVRRGEAAKWSAGRAQHVHIAQGYTDVFCTLSRRAGLCTNEVII